MEPGPEGNAEIATPVRVAGMVLVRIIVGGVLGIILTLSALVSLAFAQPGEQVARVTTDRGGMLIGYARAVHGDTIRVAGVSVRLKGVAAPELNEAFGREFAAMVAGMVNGQSVLCRLTGERSHQRAVGFCSVLGQDIGAAVVSAGLARDCFAI